MTSKALRTVPVPGMLSMPAITVIIIINFKYIISKDTVHFYFP